MVDRAIWVSEDRLQCMGVKHCRDDEFWVKCHIPGRPIFPGVLQIEASAQLASWLFRTRYPALGFLGFMRCDNVIFRGQVVPGDSFYMLIKEVSANPKRVVSDVQGLVNNKLVFEARVTGFAM